MPEKICPICPKGCLLSAPSCSRGQQYAKDGTISKHSKHKNFLRFENQDQQLVMKYLHHALRVVDSGKLDQSMTSQMFDILSNEETTELMNLLKKLSDYWIDLAKKK